MKSFSIKFLLTLSLFAGLCLRAESPCFAYASDEFVSAHDFTQYGYPGGYCDACHSAGGDSLRFFSWDAGGDDESMCAQFCHNPTTPAWPTTGGAWTPTTATAVESTYGGSPPPTPHTTVTGLDDCALCHENPDWRDCLSCHTTGVSDTILGYSSPGGSDKLYDTEVDKFFPGIGNVIDGGGRTIRSVHDINYNALGNLMDPEDNGCLKCHYISSPTEHPSQGGIAFITFPDDVDGDGMESGAQGFWRADQHYRVPIGSPSVFCFSCHDGIANAVPESSIQFTVGAQVYQVPPVPRTDYYDGGASAPPYFTSANMPNPELAAWNNYYTGNGHGSNVLKNLAGMEINCLATDVATQGGTRGCHTVHGSTSYYLLEDSGEIFNSDLDTPEKIAEMCFGCHDRMDMEASTTNMFHSWKNDLEGSVLHAGIAAPYVYWNQLPDANFMDTGPPTLVGDLQVLPFFLWADGSPESGRKYSSKTFDTSLVVTCITCHDPHGTSLVYENYEEHGEHTEGMLRIFMTTVDYSDPLCGQCHSE